VRMSCRRWRYMLGTKASIAAEVVPRSAYELQALAIHARNRALVAAEVVPRSAYELQAWRYMPKTRL
jgi:hypothetical protein